MGGKLLQLEVRSRSRNEMVDITALVGDKIRAAGIQDGVCHLFVLHTTAGLTVNEGADPTVQSDMLGFLSRVIPADPRFAHAEGNSDAHIKASLVGPSLTLLISGGQPVLGTWQAIYLCEFDGPRQRRVAIKVVAG